MMSYLYHYLNHTPEEERSFASISYLAALDALMQRHPDIAEAIIRELADQRTYLKLIASENYSSLETQLAMGNLLTDKYAEGYVGHRFYAGCANVDSVEAAAAEAAQQLFGADHAYVQPHSGADANLIALWALLVQRVQTVEMEALGKKQLDQLSAAEYERIRQTMVGQKIMGMDLYSGGHLTHGYRHNISGKMVRSVSYEVDPVTATLDYDRLAAEVRREEPTILIAGYSSYPRKIDFAKMRAIADSVGAALLTDMAHFAGLVAGKVFTGVYDPLPYSDLITSTTHKTLRGPRGGFILSPLKYRDTVNKGCPLALGGPLPHVMAAKAIAFREAMAPSFRTYAEQIVRNAQALAEGLLNEGATLLTGGTDNHLILIDVAKSFQLTGQDAERLLREGHMTVNRNAIPRDPHGPWRTSGIRVGLSALTTLGMKEGEMAQIAGWMAELLRSARGALGPKGNKMDPSVEGGCLTRIKDRVEELLRAFPLYPHLPFLPNPPQRR